MPAAKARLRSGISQMIYDVASIDTGHKRVLLACLFADVSVDAVVVGVFACVSDDGAVASSRVQQVVVDMRVVECRCDVDRKVVGKCEIE